MKTPIRLDENLVHEAKLEGRPLKRSAPNQIEYWAEIGRQVENLISPNELLAITQGFAQLHIEDTPTQPVKPGKVFKAVDQDRAAGMLANKVTQSAIYYEASQTQPNMLDRVDASGFRETGHFRNGQFITSMKR